MLDLAQALIKRNQMIKQLFVYEVTFKDKNKGRIIASSKQEVITIIKDKVPPFRTLSDTIFKRPKHILTYTIEDLEQINELFKIDLIGEFKMDIPKKKPNKMKLWFNEWYALILEKTSAPKKGKNASTKSIS